MKYYRTRTRQPCQTDRTSASAVDLQVKLVANKVIQSN